MYTIRCISEPSYLGRRVPKPDLGYFVNPFRMDAALHHVWSVMFCRKNGVLSTSSSSLRVGVLLQRHLPEGITRRGMARMIAIKDADQVAFYARNYSSIRLLAGSLCAWNHLM